jgi:acylphosphatase
MRVARRLHIRGRVQGVWYRAWLVEEATAVGVDGWVRNRADGTVEAVVAGEEARVEALIAACRRGPAAARVDGVETEPAPDPGPGGFTQRPTL